MTKIVRQSVSRQTALALAVFAACGGVHAQATDEAQASVSFSQYMFTGERANRALFDQYSNLPATDNPSVLGLDYYRRNAEAGTAVRFEGLNLLSDARSLDLRWARQGDWKLRAEYNEGLRREVNSVRSGLLGAGTVSPQVNPLTATNTGADLNLSLKRSRLGVSLSRVINADWAMDISLKGEKKEGARLFGIGMTCPSAVAPACRFGTTIATGTGLVMLPEPVDSNHTQLEARLSYGGEKLRVSAGYYGSFFNNNLGSLHPGISGSLYNPVGSLLPLSSGLQNILSQPVALPPDNQAHQLDLSGTYDFSTTTHGNFKLAYSQAVQDQDYASAGLTGAPAGVNNLGAQVTTTLMQLGLTARPLAKLGLSAKLHYEETDDQTPLALYNVEGTNSYTNRRLPLTRSRANLLASYQFAPQYRGSLGADFESIDRGVFTPTSAAAGVSALRQTTDETTFKAELRSTLTETFSGAISASSSLRKGSNWLKDNSGRGLTEVTDPADPAPGFNAGAIFMPTLANRERNKLRLHGDWQLSKELTVQAAAEGGTDRYSTPSLQGLRDTGMELFSIDVDYALSEQWHLTGFGSTGGQRLHQSRPDGYILSFDNVTSNVGLGFTGKVSSQVDLGGTVAFISDKSRYAQTLEATASANSAALLAAAGGLPDILFRQTSLNLYSKFTVDKKSTVRVDLIHQRSYWNDWAWGYNGVPFAFSDGSIVSSQPKQSLSFIGVSYIYRWL